MSNTPYKDIIFGPYEPDWGGLPRQEMPGYLVDAIGVRVTPNGYRGAIAFADVSSATTIAGGLARPLGACFYRSAAIHFFVVDASTAKIYESRNEGADTWEDVTPAATSLDSFGDFVRFGDDVVYVCAAHSPIVKDLTATHATDFSALSGSPPTGTCAARVRQHLVIGGLSTDSYAVQTSAFGDHEDWPTPGTSDARSKQSIQESLNPQYGPVRWVLGGEKFGIVVQHQALTRMTYVGGSAVYEFDTYEVNNGSDSTSGSVVSFYSRPVTDGKLWYWLSRSGVFATDGYSVRRISSGKIDEALFLNTISHPDGSTIVGSYPYTSAYDSRRELLIFAGGSTIQVLYGIKDGHFALTTPGSGTLGAVFSGVSGSVRIPYTYGVETSNGRLQRASDSATPTVNLQTGYVELDPGYNVQLQGAHLLGTGTGSLTLAYKTAASSSACDVSQSGFTNLTAATLGQKKTARDTAQYFAFRATGTGAESQLIRGIRVYYTRAQPAS